MNDTQAQLERAMTRAINVAIEYRAAIGEIADIVKDIAGRAAPSTSIEHALAKASGWVDLGERTANGALTRSTELGQDITEHFRPKGEPVVIDIITPRVEIDPGEFVRATKTTIVLLHYGVSERRYNRVTGMELGRRSDGAKFFIKPSEMTRIEKLIKAKKKRRG